MIPIKRLNIRYRSLSSGKRVSAAASLLALLFVVVLAVSYGIVQMMERSAHSSSQQLVSEVIEHIDNKINDVESVSREAAQSALGFIDDPDALSQLTRDFVAGHPYVLGSTVAFEENHFPEQGRCFAPYSWRAPDGSILHRQLGTETDYYQEEWYASAKSSGSEYWCEPYFDEGGAKIMMCTFSVPLKDAAGDLVAVLTADVGLDDLEEYISSIRPYPDSYLILRSAKGNILVNEEESTHMGNDEVVVKGTTAIGWTVELVLPFVYLIHANSNAFYGIGLLLLLAIVTVYFLSRFLRLLLSRTTARYENVIDQTEKEFRNVLINAANGFLQADLSKNRIFGEITDMSSSGERIKLDPVTLYGNTGYNEFEQWWAENGLISDQEEFLKVSNCDYLISRFEAGERKVNVFCTSKDENGNPKISRQEYFLYRDSTSKDICAFCIVWDITEEKKMERNLEEALALAESANRAKTTFLNNMSHDIRTPMNAIIGYTGLASSHIDNKEEVQEYLRKIGQSSDHLLSLINDVLDMSRIESGKVSLNEKPEMLSEIVQTIGNIIQADIQSREIVFIDSVDVLDDCVICDRLRLNQVLLNVLSNAIKYTQTGGTVSLSVTQKGLSENGFGTFEFHVKDNGMGMSEEFLKTVFDPFTRAKSSTISGIQGTGLGMAITKNIVDMMGGTIDIMSKENEGTEVLIAFRFKLAEDNAVTDDQDEKAYDFRGRKVLLVEDNEMNLEIARMILEENEFTVDVALDGTEAVGILSAAKPGDFNLVLMDIQMPVMDGYEATRQIRALPGDVSKIPIIAMTADAFAENRAAALESGMNDFVAKPFDLRNLLDTIQKYL